MSRNVQLILGGPGTGKTTHFIGNDEQEGVIERLLKDGLAPSDIAYVSFTRKAADEAAKRAMARFGFTRDELPHFRTLHSMAFQHTGMRNADVMQRADYREIAKLLGVTFTGYIDPADGPAMPSREGDLILQWMAFARARCRNLRDIWHASGEPVEWHLVKLFARTVDQYKHDMNKVDFADMLDRCTNSGITCGAKVAIIDEAQDLSTAQWNLARSLFRDAGQVFLAGDDDQSVHDWAGADVEQLFKIRAEQTVLPVSHRLPREVFDLSTSIASRISRRFRKDWQPAAHTGSVQHIADVDNIDLRNGESWMLLARNKCFTADYVRMCREQGVPFSTVEGPSVPREHADAIRTWNTLRAGQAVHATEIQEAAAFVSRWSFPIPDGMLTMQQLHKKHGLHAIGPWHDTLTGIPVNDRAYYSQCHRNGYRLQDPPGVYIGTVHSVKGGEADNVVLKTDMTYRTQVGMDHDADNEHRVFYVGVTRAKKNLFIVDAQESGGYLI